MAWLRLDDGSDDGRFLLLVIQAKCYLTRNIDTLSAGATAHATWSLIPAIFLHRWYVDGVCLRDCADYGLPLDKEQYGQTGKTTETKEDQCDARSHYH
jgi:hypothetical protein